MFNRRFKSILLSGVVAVAAVSAGSAASAATGTAAGTQIDNQASVTYTVGGNSQNATSNTASFVVDKKVDLTVAMLGSTPTQTSIGATDSAVAFTVTNNTNSVQDFRLEAQQQSLSVPLLGIDNFDATNTRIFVDSNGNGVYDPGVDTATFIDELAPDASKTVFIVGDIPNVQGEKVALVALKATAAAGGTSGTLGADLVATIGADSPTTVDVVFADQAGITDIIHDGKHSAANAWVIASTSLTLVKSSAVIWDPINLLVLPKAIPGATVKYCIVVKNTGASTATGITVNDTIPTNMTYDAGSIAVGGTALGDACLLDGTSTGGTFDGSAVHATIASLLPTAVTTVTFTAKVN